jgi:predicted anti-sigma-YlaC factor YlaD
VNCKEVADFLDAYLAGELPRMEKWFFDRHIASCRDCKNYMQGYQRTIDLSRRAFEMETLAPRKNRGNIL